MTNLDSILKSRDITLPTKVHLVKAMVFPVVTYGCESWTVKKAECRRIDAFDSGLRHHPSFPSKCCAGRGPALSSLGARGGSLGEVLLGGWGWGQAVPFAHTLQPNSPCLRPAKTPMQKPPPAPRALGCSDGDCVLALRPAALLPPAPGWDPPPPSAPHFQDYSLCVHCKDMLKLKLQYFGHLMQKTDSLEKTLML